MFKRSLLAAAITLTAVSAQAAETPSLEEMWQVIQQQQAEIKELKLQLNQTETKLEQTEVKVAATADAVEQGIVGSETVAKVASWVEKTSIGGYGEHHFSRYSDKDDKVDAHRYVLYFGHQFSNNLRFLSEFELEHGIAGEDQPGEIELEQAYIEWDYAENHSLQLGQFLVPVGIMNETHEPDTFYGTERNLVEKNIIPATWWETGAQLTGELAPALSYNLGVHSGLAIEDGDYKIRDGRQKSAKATAEDLAFTARLKYTGIAGLELAATVQQQQNVTQGDLGDDASALLTEVHAIYTTGPVQVRALWAEWDIDNELTTYLDDEKTLLGSKAGSDKQEGWYVEPSYKFTDKLGAFVRYSEYNNTAGDSTSTDTEVWEYGINYWLHPQVVLKADYTDYSSENSKDGVDSDSLNLGLGWSF